MYKRAGGVRATSKPRVMLPRVCFREAGDLVTAKLIVLVWDPGISLRLRIRRIWATIDYYSTEYW